MLVDLTLPLEEDMPTFPGHPTFTSEQRGSHDDGGAVSHYFSMTTHQGTHVDAPAHFIPGGATIDEVAPSRLVGPTRVVDLRGHRGEAIDAAVLDEHADAVGADDRVLLLTGDVDDGFNRDDFFERAAALTVDGAEWLVEREVGLLANDFLTEAVPEVTEAIAGDPARPVHHTLLGAGIPIVEYLCNADAVAEADEVELLCLPLLVPGFEAAPARALARF